MATTYEYPDIVKFTRNFRKKIGDGGFSDVFKGKIPRRFGRSTKVAVKVSKQASDIDQYENEIERMPREAHPNIIHLIGFCRQDETRYLVLPLVRGGDLSRAYLGLSWRKVLKIAKGMTAGIYHIHTVLDMVIGDLKPANVLLDKDFRPRLSDFGTLAPPNQNLDRPGTFFYQDPLSTFRGATQKDDDVYAFGIILLQILMKQEVIIGATNIATRADEMFRSGGSGGRREVVHDDLRTTGCSLEDARAISRIALAMVLHPNRLPVLIPGIIVPSDYSRPTIESVMQSLEPLRVQPRGVGVVDRVRSIFL